MSICGVQLKNRIRAKDLMLILGLNGTIDQLSMANSVRWSGIFYREHALAYFQLQLYDMW